MAALPNDLALTVINDGAQIVASDHRNNYASIQAAVNAIRDAHAGGTAGALLYAVDSTHIAYLPDAPAGHNLLEWDTGSATWKPVALKNVNVDAAAAIAYSKLNLAASVVYGDIAAAGLAAVAQTTPADPTGNSSATAKMMGLWWGPTTTTATGVNAINSGTVNVASTTGFSAAGAFLMGGVATTYTGVTATSFTGCGAHAATTGGETITAPSSFTPRSSRVFVQITGDLAVTAGGTVTTHLRYGTGNSPVNAAAVTGTVIGNSNGHLLDLAGKSIPFALNAIITGLTPATAVWFDLDVLTDGAHLGNVLRLTIDAFDLM